MSFIRRGAAFVALAGALAVVGGCVGKSDTGGPPPRGDTGKGKAEAKKDEHAETGPHGGPLAEWGEEKYHAEFTVDHGKKQATVYILDGSARKAAPIPAESITLTLTNFRPPLTLALKAEPQEGDPVGQSSRFSGKDDRLAGEAKFKGEISGKVGDTPYAGDFGGK